jgi:hypothetical protein
MTHHHPSQAVLHSLHSLESKKKMIIINKNKKRIAWKVGSAQLLDVSASAAWHSNTHRCIHFT